MPIRDNCRDVLTRNQGWLEKADHEQTRRLQVLGRGFCGKVLNCIVVSVQKSNRLQESLSRQSDLVKCNRKA